MPGVLSEPLASQAATKLTPCPPPCRAAGLISVLAAVLAPGSSCGAGLRALAVQQAAALSGDAAAAAEFAARGGVAGMMALVRCGAAVSARASVTVIARGNSGRL